LTIGDIAKRFKVSKATVHNWMARGIIKGVKVGKNRYFTEDEIQSIFYFLKKWHWVYSLCTLRQMARYITLVVTRYISFAVSLTVPIRSETRSS